MIQWPLRGPEFEKKEERKPKPAFFQRTNFNYQKNAWKTMAMLLLLFSLMMMMIVDNISSVNI